MSPEEYAVHRERVMYFSEHPLAERDREDPDADQTELSEWGPPNMPRCECGTWLSPDYVRALLPDDVEEIEACFECEGAGLRHGGEL